MENLEQNQVPNTVGNQTPTPENKPKEGLVGPIIGSIIVIILVIVGGLYFWGTVINERQTTQTEAVDLNEDETLNDLTTQSDSDEVNSIEEDLNSTDLDNLDEELRDIEEEFDNI
jgi:uncharacterized protein YpmB